MKLRKGVLALLLAGTMIMTAGCGGDTKEAGKGEGEAADDSLVIYSTHSEEMLETICSAFEEETGIEVEYINLKGELADRVRSEKENPQADIMFGGDSATYTLLNEEGLFDQANPAWASDLNDAYKDADGNWYGTIKTPVMIFYNSDIISADQAPTDWNDLVDPAYENTIVTRDSLSSSMRSTISCLIDNISKNESEDAAWTYLQGLDANTKGYYNSGSMMFEAIGKGEAGVSCAVLSDIIDNRDNNGMPLEIVDAASGSVILTDCIAKIKNAPHPNAAEQFIEFAGSVDMQTQIANEYNRMPTLDAALEGAPEWMKTEYKAMDVDWANISANQSEWLEKWETDVIDGSKGVE